MGALRSQSKLTLLSVDGMKQSLAGHDEVSAVKSELVFAAQGSLPDDVSAQLKTLSANLNKLGGMVQAGGGGGGPRRGPVDPHAIQSFLDLNNTFNTMVSMMQVGLDMAPTPTQISSWETACTNYNNTVAAWKAMPSQVTELNALLEKNHLSAITIPPTKLDEMSCSFGVAEHTRGSKKGAR